MEENGPQVGENEDKSGGIRSLCGEIAAAGREINSIPRLRELGAGILAVTQLAVISGGIKHLSQTSPYEAVVVHEAEVYREDMFHFDSVIGLLSLDGLRSTSDITHLETVSELGAEAAESTESISSFSKPSLPTPVDSKLDTVDSGHANNLEESSLEVATDSVKDTIGELKLRSMPYEHFAADSFGMIWRLPTLGALSELSTSNPMTSNIEAQREFIDYLNDQAVVTPEGYRDFSIDMSRQNAFVDSAHYHQLIEPKMFIVHWTAWGYDDVDHFIRSMRSSKPHPLRVMFFMDRAASTYQLFETDRNKPAHALGANGFSQGVEIETGEFDNVNSPLFSYTPQQIENTVYLAVDFLRRNNLPVDETTLVGHYAADLIFTNPYYDPRKGTFLAPRVRKFDPPEELMLVIVNKAQALDRSLG